MTEDARALEDGPALDPTNRLRGLAAVEEVVAAVEVWAMSKNRSSDLADFWALGGTSMRMDVRSWETPPSSSILAGWHLSQPHVSGTLLLPTPAAGDIRDASLRHSTLKALVPISPFVATRNYDDDTLRVRHGRSVCDAWIMWDQGMVRGCFTLSV